MTLNDTAVNKRITSLDALRAIAIFGILLAHAAGGFGFSTAMGDTMLTSLDGYVAQVIRIFFTNRSNVVFSILFGISFYLILKNPNYSWQKFIWRCVLLVMIGALNQLFYSYDVLIIYGLFGVVLVLFRKAKPVYLLAFFCIFFLAEDFLGQYKLGTLLLGKPEGVRYQIDTSFSELITYPYTIIDLFRGWMNAGIFRYLAMFLLGYFIAKVGIIDNIRQYNSKWIVLSLLVLTIVFAAIKVVFSPQYDLAALFCALFYMSLFFWFYYNADILRKFFQLLEPFGKCGLTNYSLINALGVLTMANFGLGWINYSFTTIVCMYVCMYVCMVVLSFYWIKYFKYGPMEWLWRCATERKWFKNRR